MSENQKDPQYKLRWNEDLRDKVMVSAKENNRSINQEIIARLEGSFEERPRSVDEVITQIESSMKVVFNNLVKQGISRDAIVKAIDDSGVID